MVAHIIGQGVSDTRKPRWQFDKMSYNGLAESYC